MPCLAEAEPLGMAAGRRFLLPGADSAQTAASPSIHTRSSFLYLHGEPEPRAMPGGLQPGPQSQQPRTGEEQGQARVPPATSGEGWRLHSPEVLFLRSGRIESLRGSPPQRSLFPNKGRRAGGGGKNATVWWSLWSGKDRVAGWGLGLRCQPGLQELLVLLVGSRISVSTCGFLGSRPITFVCSSKGFMPRGVGRTSAERLVWAAPVAPTGEAVPGEPGLLAACCALSGRPPPSPGGPGRGGGGSSPHRHGPCCHRRVEVCGQTARQSGQAPPWTGLLAGSGGQSSHQGTEPAPNSGLHQSPCCHCGAPPEVGLLRVRVLMPGCRPPGSPLLVAVPRCALHTAQRSCPLCIDEQTETRSEMTSHGRQMVSSEAGRPGPG